MIPLVSTEDLKAWFSETKISVPLSLTNDALLDQIQGEVIGQLGSRYSTESWLSPETTPALVRKIIAMRFTGWTYLRVFSEEDTENAYGMRLLLEADDLLVGLVSGSLPLIEGGIEIPPTALGTPLFEPIESEPYFKMDKVW